MKIFNVEQGSHEWLTLRLGKVTGSIAKDIMKGDNLPIMDQLIAELGSEQIEETYQTWDMQRGAEKEPFAKNHYTAVTGNEITEYGFIQHSQYDWLGLSPDGIIKPLNKGIEVKCPKTATHVRYIRQNQIPNEYKYQVYCYFLVAGVDSVDFVSYDDRFKVKPMHIVSVTRNEIKSELDAFENDLVKFWNKLQKYYGQIIF